MPGRRISFLVAVSLLASTSLASAQGVGAGGGVVGSAGVITSPVGSQPSLGAGAMSPVPSAGATTGMTGGLSQPGAPNSVSPGTIGTGGRPSGLPGDNPSAPGFPGKVGK